jgi:hypothetical protein
LPRGAFPQYATNFNALAFAKVCECLCPRVCQSPSILAPGVADTCAIRGIGGQTQASAAVIQASPLDYCRDEMFHVLNWGQTDTFSRMKGCISSDNHGQGGQRALGHHTGIFFQCNRNAGPGRPCRNQEFEHNLVERLLKQQWLLDDC